MTRTVLGLSALGLLALASLAPKAAAATFDRLIAFGDSLTDDAFGDGHGFNRYSNGPVWVDYLADRLGVAGRENRAWGGAMTGDGNANGFGWSGLTWQVAGFTPSGDLSRTLVTVWIGVNDVYAGEADVTASVGNIVRALDLLATKGARAILVPNLPDITLAPAYQAGRSYAAKATAVRALVEEFNRRLDTALADGTDSFTARQPEVRLYRLDAHRLFAKLAQDGSFDNTVDPWFGTYSYPAANGYMWWDERHPMTEVHRQVAAAAADVLRSGP